MCDIEAKLHTFNDFKNIVLPRIEAGGYNVIQLMAIL